MNYLSYCVYFIIIYLPIKMLNHALVEFLCSNKTFYRIKSCFRYDPPCAPTSSFLATDFLGLRSVVHLNLFNMCILPMPYTEHSDCDIICVKQTVTPNIIFRRSQRFICIQTLKFETCNIMKPSPRLVTQ